MDPADGENAPPAKRRSILSRLQVLVIVGAGILVVAFVLGNQSLRTHGAKDRSGQIAADIGASSCSQEDFEITNRLDGSKTRIYDCFMPNLNYKCVTYENGVENDVTETVKLLWANVLGSAKPICIGG